MMLRFGFLILFCGFILSACAPASGGPKAGPAVQQPTRVEPLSHQRLREELARLPGARLSPGDPLQVSYPAGSLFAESALLPMPGGAGALDALAAVLRQSHLSWVLRVRASTGEGAAYDAKLAAERARILQLYLTNAGVDLRRISLMSVAEAGAPLELSLAR